MRITERVEAGDPGTEDYDVGKVVGIRAGAELGQLECMVAWRGAHTVQWHAESELRPYSPHNEMGALIALVWDIREALDANRHDDARAARARLDGLTESWNRGRSYPPLVRDELRSLNLSVSRGGASDE